MDFGGAWWSVVDRGGSWWNVVEVVERGRKKHEIMKAR